MCRCRVVNPIMVDSFLLKLHDGGSVRRLNYESLLNPFQMIGA